MTNVDEKNSLSLDINGAERVRSGFNKLLNSHGYSFPSSVLKKLEKLHNERQSRFVFETIEFPAIIREKDSRIDFVLSHRLGNGIPLFLLAECKRANPALSNWCFVPFRYMRRDVDYLSDPVIVESINWGGEQFNAIGKALAYTNNLVHLGIEVKSNKPGDQVGESGRAIEDACGQILKGLNGFVEWLYLNQQICGVYSGAFLLPVIFTTASLWISEVDLSETDLITGNIDLEAFTFKKVNWLCYQYHQSPGLKHTRTPNNVSSAITKLMEEVYIRTIPVVNVHGIEEFMNWASRL